MLTGQAHPPVSYGVRNMEKGSLAPPLYVCKGSHLGVAGTMKVVGICMLSLHFLKCGLYNMVSIAWPAAGMLLMRTRL